MKSLVCPVCGKSFEPKYKNQIYCGRECSEIGIRRVKAERKRNGVHLMCTMCGVRFFTTVPERDMCTACTSVQKKKDQIKNSRFTYKEIAAKNRANPIESGWRGQMRIAARPALTKFD